MTRGIGRSIHLPLQIPLVLIAVACNGTPEEPSEPGPPPVPTPIEDISLSKIHAKQMNASILHIASTDDLDGDGHADFFVGYNTSSHLTPDESIGLRVFPSSLEEDIAPEDALATMRSRGASVLKANVHGNGDLNGDGWEDYLYVDSDHPIEATYAVAGGMLGDIPTDNPIARINFEPWICDAEISPDLNLHVEDLTNDGIADVLAWCNTFPNDPSYGSADYLGLFRGPLAGELSAWDADLYILNTIDEAAFLGGGGVRGVGDMSGDGIDELAVFSWEYHDEFTWAYLFLSASTTGQVDHQDIDDALLNDDEVFVNTIVAANDVNGDGYADIAYSAFRYDYSSGSVGVAHGPIEGPVHRADAQVFTVFASNRNWDWSIGLTERQADLDGDGWVDLLLQVGTDVDAGDRLYVVHGPLEGTCSLDDFASVGGFVGGGSWAQIDDIDGDALPDFAVEDWDEGIVYLLPGTAL